MINEQISKCFYEFLYNLLNPFLGGLSFFATGSRRLFCTAPLFLAFSRALEIGRRTLLLPPVHQDLVQGLVLVLHEPDCRLFKLGFQFA